MKEVKNKWILTWKINLSSNGEDLWDMQYFIRKVLNINLSLCNFLLKLYISLTSIKINSLTISPFVIDGNNLLICYSPYHRVIPLAMMFLPLLWCCSPCHCATPYHDVHLVMFSPFNINSKGILYLDVRDITPIFWWRYSNASWGRDFVKISTMCFLMLKYSILMFFSTTCSQRKWYLIGICFVFECMTRFLRG